MNYTSNPDSSVTENKTAHFLPPLLFLGDCHGDFDTLRQDLSGYNFSGAIMVGDQCPANPLHHELGLAEMDPRLWFILGNHDGDRSCWLRGHFPAWNGFLHRRTARIGGMRVAGLSGVFRGRVWRPPDKPVYRTRRELSAGKDLPRRHWASIFPEDVSKLSVSRADILVTHEAPSCHEYGFRVIDDLAQAMGAWLIVFGHHHVSMDKRLNNGIRAIGLAKQEVLPVNSSPSA